jgi:hypothetical protein
MEDDWIKKYRGFARDYAEGIRKSNPNKTNRAHDALWDVLKQIVGASCDHLLFDLYSDEELWAAAHTLEVYETRAISKLQTLADAGIKGLSLSAEYTIKEWSGGELNFRPRM